MILESIIQLAIKLGLKVTAEGIETVQQAEILTRLAVSRCRAICWVNRWMLSNLKLGPLFLKFSKSLFRIFVIKLINCKL